MKLKVLGSSSSGNCYILENDTEALIIEAGVNFKEVKKALDFNLRKVVGCLVTHQHNDHAKYIKAMVENGFPTLALPEVWEAKGVWDSRSISAEPYKGKIFGHFKVLPYPANHDVPCLGYLISHPEMGKMMFLTDSCTCDYTFPGLNQVLIECNYSQRALVDAINQGRTHPHQMERLERSHLELQACKAFLQSNDLSQVEHVVLLHLSDNNSNEQLFVSEVEKCTGKLVYAARPGLTLELMKL